MSDVIIERRDATEVIRFNRPHRGNSLSGTLFKDILDGWEAAALDPDIRAVLTIGEGRSYCVGADRDALGENASDGPIDLNRQDLDHLGGVKGVEYIPPAEDTLGIGRWVQRIVAIEKPSVAAVNGGAGGGGFAIALLHDVRIAARTAKFATGWPALGLGPEMGVSWILPRLVGQAAAFDICTRLTPIEADEALELGLVDQVVGVDDVLDAALARAEELGRVPPLAYAAAKRLLFESGYNSFDEQLEREWTEQKALFLGDDATAIFRSLLQRADG